MIPAIRASARSPSDSTWVSRRMTMTLRRLAATAAIGLLLAGCSSYLAETPEDFLTPTSFPTTENDLKIALGGIDNWYTGGSNQAYYIRGWPMLTEVPSDQTILINNTTDSK